MGKKEKKYYNKKFTKNIQKLEVGTMYVFKFLLQYSIMSISGETRSNNGGWIWTLHRRYGHSTGEAHGGGIASSWGWSRQKAGKR